MSSVRHDVLSYGRGRWGWTERGAVAWAFFGGCTIGQRGIAISRSIMPCSIYGPPIPDLQACPDHPILIFFNRILILLVKTIAIDFEGL